jgi:uncharacterized phage protein (TIGR02216 family)
MSFPWGRLMRTGLGELRLAPRDFWSMTLKELAAAAGRDMPDVGTLRRLINDGDAPDA